ncbi:MAG: Rrf2 family transcriptional regulator [Planctomycetales bacterium]|nr:Rrf2 family transcriptional regulator [Planctomycetales bacterium]
MISQTAEYALRAVVFLGKYGGQSCTTADLAEQTAAPPSYLAKVLKGLNRAGIVDSQRGLHGGYRLVREPYDLTVLDVIRAVDGFHRIEHCPLGRAAHASALCPLHRRIDNVIAEVENAFAQATIGDVLDEPGLLCDLPCVRDPLEESAESAHR